MISLLPAHRRAEEFAAQVDGAGGKHARTIDPELLEVVGALRQVGSPEPRPEFVSDLRARLMAEADVALSPVDHKQTVTSNPRSRRDRRIAVVAGTAALLGATTSVAVAAQGTLPGDTLYPVKRAIEGLHTTLTIDDGARAETVLEQATGRLAEAESLARRVDTSQSGEVPETLDDFAAKADEGAGIILDQYAADGDPRPVNELHGFLDDSMKKLVDLDALLPSSATESLNRAATVLTGINDRILAACPECTSSVLEVPTRLTLALRASDDAPQVVAKRSEPTTPKIGGQAPLDPDQVIDPDDLPLDLPSSGATEQPPGDDPVEKTAKPVRKTVTKTVDGLGDTLKKGNEVLLGEDDGLLGPVLDPLLDPLIGKGGLLSD